MSLAPDTRAEIDADLAAALKELLDHAPEYETRSSYYHGKVDEVVVHEAVAKAMALYKDKFRFNYAGIPADALADRLDLQGLRASKESINAKITELLWDANDLDDEADDYHLHANYLGDFYVITWPAEEEVDSRSAIELTPRHPSTTRILYESGNPRKPRVGIARWKTTKDTDGRERWRIDLYYDDQRHRFIATGDGTKPEAFVYLTIDEDGVEVDDVEAHDWGFPIHHFRPDSKPYGVPVNAGAYGPQDAITKVLSSQISTVDALAAPGRVALLDSDAEQGDDIDADFGGIVDEDDEEKTTPTAGPGSTEYLRGVRDLKFIEPGDPDGFLKPLDFYIRQIPVLTRTPLREFVPMPGGSADSGEARRREDAPITKHAKKIAGSYGRTWKGIGDFCLRVWGEKPEVIEPVWMPAEVSTDKEGIELIASKIATGMHPREAFREAGYTADQVEEWFPEDVEGEGMMGSMTPALLTVLAGALQQLGSAKTQGSITDTQIAGLLARYLGIREVGEEVTQRGYVSAPLEPTASPNPADPTDGPAA
jgi:hypothetical protein